MRILQVISQLSDFAGDSGQVLLIAKNLQELGHEVTIVTTDGDYFFNQEESSKRYAVTRQKLLNAKDKIVEINGITVYPAHCISPRMGMYSPNATKLAKKIIKNYDIVHIYSWYHYLGLVFYKTAYKYKIPFFISFWGTLQPGSHKFHKNKKFVLDVLYTKKAILRATGLHSIGNSETTEYIKWGVNPKKIHCIDNGVVLENYEIKNKTKIFERLGINCNQKFLLYLGRIHEKKGIELLLTAFKKLVQTHNDLLFLISGTGIESYLMKVKKFAKDLDIENKIKFSGFVSEDEKLELLQHAKIFALTSYDDIHPRAIQDALIMGLPVVITKTCDYPEVEEYQAGMIVELDVESIYIALKKILENPNTLKLFSQNAKKLIKEKFLLADQVKKFERIYLDAIHK